MVSPIWCGGYPMVISGLGVPNDEPYLVWGYPMVSPIWSGGYPMVISGLGVPNGEPYLVWRVPNDEPYLVWGATYQWALSWSGGLPIRGPCLGGKCYCTLSPHRARGPVPARGACWVCAAATDHPAEGATSLPCLRTHP